MSVAHVAALTLNAAASLGSAGWAIVALRRPSRLSGTSSPSAGELYYARLYAARALPLEAAAAALPFVAGGPTILVLLLATAAVQGADAALGLRLGKNDMAGGAFVAALVHAVSAFVLS